MNTFLFAFNAIMPIVLLGAFGYLLKRIGFFDRPFINMLNKYIFRIGLPALLFYTVYNIDGFQAIDWEVIWFAVVAFLLFFGLAQFSLMFMVRDATQKGVILQAVTRGNFALIGIPLAGSLGGTEGLAVVAILSAFVIPLTNILSVVALTMYQRDEHGARISVTKVIKSVFANPLILAVFAAFLILFVRSWIPAPDGVLVFSLKRDVHVFYEMIRLISLTATPLALIALGGSFELSVIRNLFWKIVLGVGWRIAIVPGFTLVAAYLMIDRIPGLVPAFPALIALFGAPVAVSSVVMVSQIGGDEQLAGQLVVWSTILSMLTIFIAAVVFRTLGVL